MKTLKKFAFPEKTGGIQAKYDWDTMLSGAIVQVVKGEDYDVDTKLIGHMAYSQARRRQMTVRLQPVDGDSKPCKMDEAVGLVLQASPASEEQIASWAKADAEKKQRKADKKAEANGDDDGDAAE